ncbi:MAG: hypothetical protein C5B50_23730 [Verrucomicrobia bacterium]|nr:MAG: hypothetical protein C5B50_23730 [Verrucomicrobiota bacterium]
MKTGKENANEPLTAVRQYVQFFNKGDAKGMVSVCADPMAILDGLPPHTWHGAKAAEEWYSDVLVAGEKEGAGGYIVSLGEPWHINVTGDSAYVVVPASMTFQARGLQISQSGAVFTVALRRFPAGWRLTAWAWAKGTR